MSGVGSFAPEVVGLTAADTGGGIRDAVATLSGGTVVRKSAKTVGNVSNEVTTNYTKRVYNSSTGDAMVEDTKTKTGLALEHDGEGVTEARGCNPMDGSLNKTETISEETRNASIEFAGETAEVTREISEAISFESVVDTTDCGTHTMGGMVSPRGSLESTLKEIKTVAYTFENLTDAAVTGILVKSRRVRQKTKESPKSKWSKATVVTTVSSSTGVSTRVVNGRGEIV